MSHEFALSSLRSLVSRRVEHEKRNSESASDHVLFYFLKVFTGKESRLYQRMKNIGSTIQEKSRKLRRR